MNADALVGFDLDGVFITNGHSLHVAAIKGVLADEARFEHGGDRIALAIQARLERRHLQRSDRIITSSRYSAEQIARFYSVSASRIHIVPEPIDLRVWHDALRKTTREEGPLRAARSALP